MLEQCFLALDLNLGHLVVAETVMVMQNHLKFESDRFEFLIEKRIGTNPEAG